MRFICNPCLEDNFVVELIEQIASTDRSIGSFDRSDRSACLSDKSIGRINRTDQFDRSIGSIDRSAR